MGNYDRGRWPLFSLTSKLLFLCSKLNKMYLLESHKPCLFQNKLCLHPLMLGCCFCKKCKQKHTGSETLEMQICTNCE